MLLYQRKSAKENEKNRENKKKRQNWIIYFGIFDEKLKYVQ